MVRLRKPAAIVCDIEGTTTSMRFWVEVLSPFIRDNTETCLREMWDCPETIDVITLLRNRTIEDILNGDIVPPIADENASQREIIDSVGKNVRFQMQQRRHSNELKSIQLLVWLYGYQNEMLKGHVYKDVQPTFERWRRELGIRIFIFATGITIAQKMLFACSLSGNMTPFIEDYFDGDTVGKKIDQESYRNIAKIINESCQNILFLSDNIQELKAASNSGLNPILVIRTHNKDLLNTNVPFRYIKSFDDLEFI